jgi:hypothetical protein
MFKRILPARKLSATVFWDISGVIMEEFMQQGTIIMLEVYCTTLNEVCRAIQNERCGILTSRALILLLHDNVRPHMAVLTPALVDHCKWELSDTLLRALISLRATTTSLPAGRTG